jgi:hypothetical protein
MQLLRRRRPIVFQVLDLELIVWHSNGLGYLDLGHARLGQDSAVSGAENSNG